MLLDGNSRGHANTILFKPGSSLIPTKFTQDPLLKPQKAIKASLHAGVSPDLPSYMQLKNEIRVRESPRNPQVGLKNNFTEFCIVHKDQGLNNNSQSVKNIKALLTLNACQVQNHIRTSMKPKLLRNAINILGGTQQNQNFEKPLQTSAMLKMGLQDYNIKESGYQSLKNHIRIPQKTQHSYDCILNTNKTIKPPDIPIEVQCPYYQHYYLMINNQPKIFHHKPGLFSYFIEKTKNVTDSLQGNIQENLPKEGQKLTSRKKSESIKNNKSGKSSPEIQSVGSSLSEQKNCDLPPIKVYGKLQKNESMGKLENTPEVKKILRKAEKSNTTIKALSNIIKCRMYFGK